MKSKNNWEKVRAKGSFHFAFTRGVLGAGCIFLFPTYLSSKVINNEPIFTLETLGALLGSVVLGYLLAGIIWSINESNYNGPSA